MPKKIRVYELAKELGLTNKEALDLVLSLGIDARSHSSSIEDQQADRARRKAEREGLGRHAAPSGDEAAPAAQSATAGTSAATSAPATNAP
ncbi:MAG: translation initiation factor IF-2 N-terminal domain-containing protein, partial [Acidimicrobiaceae bacterium]|nr:translation initiation factor IF-2 N-terminal domain-containing protein [Acidimicrobiaceae bacterium]